MDYIEKLDLQTEEMEEIDVLEKHSIIINKPFTVDEYEGHTRDFLAIGEDYDDGFIQLNETNGLAISCNVSKEVKEARKDVNGNIHEKLKNRIDSEVNDIKTSLENMKSEKSGLNNKRIDIINDVTDTEGNLNVANFAGQNDGVNAPIGQIIHHYTDGTNIQIDNVGCGDILVLKNANNPSRRPDKPADYVGTGAFLNFIEHQESGSSKRIFKMDNKGNMYWFDVTDTINIGTNKAEDGKYCFSINSYQSNENLIVVTNGYSNILELRHKDGIVEINSIGGQKIRIVSDNDLILDSNTNVYIQKSPFVCYDGENYARPVMQLVGDETNRPINPPIGTMYWDTVYNMPIFWNGVTWVKADGIYL